MIFIGIDPGRQGAMCLMDELLGTIEVYDFEDGGSLEALKAAARRGDAIAALEKVSAMPKEGAASSFKFGTNFGTWIGRLESLGIPFDYVTPQKWQKAIYDSMPAKGVDKKLLSLDRARRLFPHLSGMLTRKKDHNRADALLIAEYCRQKHEGEGK